MPKKDRTFSNKDVIRLYDHYLTVSERRKAREYICGEDTGEIEEIEQWPPEVCYPLYEILDMVQFAISITRDIWSMSQLAVNLTASMKKISTTLEWFPVFGEIIRDDLAALEQAMSAWDKATLSRLEALQAYFAKVETYVTSKCHPRR
jgi:hypothetical protein